VEDEEIIGTLIETNDRIITALESYDKVRLHKTSPPYYLIDTVSSPNRMSQNKMSKRFGRV
jgi:hypothetical protein